MSYFQSHSLCIFCRTFVQNFGDVAVAACSYASTSPLSIFLRLSIDRSGQSICFHYFFLYLSEGIITAVPEDNYHERLAGEMRMPLQWIQEAVMRQSKLDHLNSRQMKNYVNNHSGKVKRSRMWAPPLRSVMLIAA